jgi:hypothetical protein
MLTLYIGKWVRLRTYQHPCSSYIKWETYAPENLGIELPRYGVNYVYGVGFLLRFEFSAASSGSIQHLICTVGSQWPSWMRQCDKGRKVGGSISHGDTGNFYWINPFVHPHYRPWVDTACKQNWIAWVVLGVHRTDKLVTFMCLWSGICGSLKILEP